MILRKVFTGMSLLFLLLFFENNAVCQGINNSSGYVVIPATSYVYTQGYTAGASSSTSVSGNMFVSGDWTNNSGTITFTSGTVTFNGSGTQNITGSNLTEFYNLIIASSSSTQVPAGKYLTVDGALTMTGNLSLLSNASSPCASLIDAGSNSGNLTVQRHLAGGKRQHFLSSPIDNGSFNTIHDASNGDYNVYWYDETNISTTGEIGWTRILSGSLVDARGYTAIYDAWTTRTFQGTLNTASDITISITKTPSGNDPADGWNLVGNPYPSPINAATFVSDNAAIYGSLYFFDSDTSGGAGYSTADYSIYNALGDTASSGGGLNVAPNGTIAIGQAFFVKKLYNGTSSLAFKNSQRLHSSSTQFFIPDPIEKQRIKLSVSNEHGLKNSIIIGFVEDATMGLDRMYDAPKLKGNQNLSFYSIWDKNNWGILGLPLITNQELVIPLGLDIGIETDHQIEFDLLENLPSSARVYLEDKFLQKIIEFDENQVYKFTSTKGEFTDRFAILINPNLISVDKLDKSPFQVFTNGLSIHINNPEHLMGKIVIHDILGKELFRSNLEGVGSEIVDANLASAYYLVSILTDQETFTQKIYIQ